MVLLNILSTKKTNPVLDVGFFGVKIATCFEALFGVSLTMFGVSMGVVTIVRVVVPFLKGPGKRIIPTHDGSMGLEYLPNYR